MPMRKKRSMTCALWLGKYKTCLELEDVGEWWCECVINEQKIFAASMLGDICGDREGNKHCRDFFLLVGEREEVVIVFVPKAHFFL